MPDDLLTHLIRSTDALLGRPLLSRERLGIAVSGGADSMALLALARQSWPGQVWAATVDHGLRPAAAQEAAMVARWAAGQAIPHETLCIALPAGGNVQARARTLRYAALEEWADRHDMDWMMTAHHADDLFETVLMRLGRGAGVGGLSAIRRRRGRWLRPLLELRRSALRGFCEVASVPFADDPSNADPRYGRARLRAELAGELPVDPAGLVRSASAAAEADEALEWMVEEIARAHLRLEQGSAHLVRADWPAALRRRLLVRMIAHLNPQAPLPRGPRMDQALVQLSCGKTVSLSDCVISGGPDWTARRAPPRRFDPAGSRCLSDSTPLPKARATLS